jgi:site-specific recombinase XerD
MTNFSAADNEPSHTASGELSEPRPRTPSQAGQQHPNVYPCAHFDDQITSDAQAIAIFLNQKKSSGEPRYAGNTRQSYEKELRRLILFCQDHQLGFKHLNLGLLNRYLDWLQSPPAHYIGTSRRPCNDPDWRPFSGPLSATSLHQAIAICKSFFSFLLKLGYLKNNPFALINTNTQARRIAESERKNRTLLLTDIRTVKNHFKSRPTDCNDQHRKRWLFDAYLYSGVRLSDLITHDTTALRNELVKGESLWVLHLIGKGGKPASLPVSKIFMQSLFDYRRSLGKQPIPPSGSPEPFFFDLKGRRGLRSRQAIHNIFKALIDEVADTLDREEHVEQAQRLRRSSLHWLRHSFVTIGLDISNDIPAIAELARHADIKTTMSYDKSEYQHLANLLDKMADTINAEPAETLTPE